MLLTILMEPKTLNSSTNYVVALKISFMF